MPDTVIVMHQKCTQVNVFPHNHCHLPIPSPSSLFFLIHSYTPYPSTSSSHLLSFPLLDFTPSLLFLAISLSSPSPPLPSPFTPFLPQL